MATDDQIQKVAALVKRVDLKDFSVCQFSNPGSPFDLEYIVLTIWSKE